MKHLKIEGYTNTWDMVDSITKNGKKYYLLENNIYGDETCYLLVNENLEVLGETFDDIETAIEDYEVL